jgi:transcriptional regulator with XRE-family HTH domain
MVMPSGKQPAPGQLARAFSAHVRTLKDDQGITTQALATSAGMSRNYLGKRLRDEVSFTLNDVEALCKALGIEPPKV